MGTAMMILQSMNLRFHRTYLDFPILHGSNFMDMIKLIRIIYLHHVQISDRVTTISI